MDMYQKREIRKNKKMDENAKSLPSTSINWYPGHMAKTKRQIIDDLKLIDVVIELLDARIPVSSQNPDIAQIIKNKKRIVILNKSDLADKLETDKWINHFKNKGIIAINTDSNSGNGMNRVLESINCVMKEELEKNAVNGRIGKKIRVLVLGIPNVGKSSFINRISKKTSAEVGNKPGVTKSKQWIKVDDRIELLDTPGVLWPKFESEEVALNLAYTGTIKDDILDKVEVAYFLLKYLLQNYIVNISNRYNISIEEIKSVIENNECAENENIYEIMMLIGKKRGALVSGGSVDDTKVANIILEDFRTGKLGKITLEKA